MLRPHAVLCRIHHTGLWPPCGCGRLQLAGVEALVCTGLGPVATNYTVAQVMSRKQGWLPQTREQYLSFTGPLCYEYSLLLGTARDHDGIHPLPATHPGGGSGEVDGDRALIYTVLGSWALLTHPGLAEVTRHEPSRAQTRSDRQAGISASAVTHASGRRPATAPATDNQPGETRSHE
jgi:hypothetical protein